MPPHIKRPRSSQRLVAAAALVVLGVVLQAAFSQSVLESHALASTFVSQSTWANIVDALGGQLQMTPTGGPSAQVGFLPLLLIHGVFAGSTWPGGAWWVARRTARTYRFALADWGSAGWRWWLLPGIWEICNLSAFLMGSLTLQSLVAAVPHLFAAMTLAGWLATFITLSSKPAAPAKPTMIAPDHFRVPGSVVLLVVAYTCIFTVMNWQLYRGLLIPHGDSAMYEEHLWNVLHGKGFRSYLDQGLFLGEHIQVIHLLLVPLYVLWPSHMTLEFCESLALGVGAIPVFWMTLRHTGSSRAALSLAGAYLLFAPLHFLDIAIDFKTFRPIGFGVPILLFAFDLLERRRYRSMGLMFLLALLAKEDYAIILAPLGIWIAVFQSNSTRQIPAAAETENQPAASIPVGRQSLFWGIGTAVVNVVYLILVVAVIIPWFRLGGDVHYSQYFGELGNSPADILRTSLADPLLLLQHLLRSRTLIYALLLLAPLGFLPLLSPSRLAVGLPLFGMLCLLELGNSSDSADSAFLVPFHHFHAPLVPVLFWSAAAGLGRLVGQTSSANERRPARWRDKLTPSANFAASFALTSALAVGLLLSPGPGGIAFWDPNSPAYWGRQYVPGKRAEMFPRVAKLIPPEARVASTDFIHPRFTHHARSYDYSNYARKVSGYENRVPDDTDFIVIDTQHPYSTIKSPSEVRELQTQPENWELLPDKTDGYFIVLKRKRRPHD